MVHGPEPRTEQGGESRKTVGLEPTHIKCRVAADDSDNDGDEDMQFDQQAEEETHLAKTGRSYEKFLMREFACTVLAHNPTYPPSIVVTSGTSRHSDRRSLPFLLPPHRRQGAPSSLWQIDGIPGYVHYVVPTPHRLSLN